MLRNFGNSIRDFVCFRRGSALPLPSQVHRRGNNASADAERGSGATCHPSPVSFWSVGVPGEPRPSGPREGEQEKAPGAQTRSSHRPLAEAPDAFLNLFTRGCLGPVAPTRCQAHATLPRPKPLPDHRLRPCGLLRLPVPTRRPDPARPSPGLPAVHGFSEDPPLPPDLPDPSRSSPDACSVLVRSEPRGAFAPRPVACASLR